MILKTTLLVSSVVLAGSFAQAVEPVYNTDYNKSTHTTEFTESAKSGFMFEPMVLAEASDLKPSVSNGAIAENDGSLRGGGLGLRIGGHINDTFFYAADGRYTREDFKNNTYATASSWGYNYGATIGAQTPYYGVRVWGTGVLGGSLDPASGANGVDLRFDNPKGWRVGAGVHVYQVAVNLEYQDLKYGSTVVQNAGAAAIDTDNTGTLTQRGATLSVGFPIEL